MRIRIVALSILLLVSAGCSELLNVLQTTANVPLTEEEVVKGLKEALSIGARNSAEKLGAEDGYFGDPAVRILLPEEARVIADNISRIPGGEQLIGDVILRINRAAEDAANPKSQDRQKRKLLPASLPRIHGLPLPANGTRLQIQSPANWPDSNL